MGQEIHVTQVQVLWSCSEIFVLFKSNPPTVHYNWARAWWCGKQLLEVRCYRLWVEWHTMVRPWSEMKVPDLKLLMTVNRNVVHTCHQISGRRSLHLETRYKILYRQSVRYNLSQMVHTTNPTIAPNLSVTTPWGVWQTWPATVLSLCWCLSKMLYHWPGTWPEADKGVYG